MSCNICCNNFNRSTHAKICCPYCEFETCRECSETYLLNENSAKCMKPECGKEWSRKFLRETFTNKFLNSKYKNHLEDVLFSREKSLMPATQVVLEEIIRKRKIMNESAIIDGQIAELREKQGKLLQQIYNKQKDERREFVRQCPSNDCRGFLSTQWKCGLCEQWTCPYCHEIKGKNRDCEHQCDPNLVETAKLLANDSRPCPKCQSLIFKIDGCDQMWCTQCHTAFSWKTGNIQSKIHNPHYFEWLRKTNRGVAPREVGDVECGREMDTTICTNLLGVVKRHSSLYKIQQEKSKYSSYSSYGSSYVYSQYIEFVKTIIMNTIHNIHDERPRLEHNYILLNENLRIKYLENLLTEDEFKVLIQRNNKKEIKNGEIIEVITLSVTVLTDIIHRLTNHLAVCEVNKYNLDTYLYEISEIRNYCNNMFRDISFTYNSVQYLFSENFKFIIHENYKKLKKNDTNIDSNEKV